MEASREEVKIIKVTITMTGDEALELEFLLNKIWNWDNPSAMDRDFALKLDRVLGAARKADQ